MCKKLHYTCVTLSCFGISNPVECDYMNNANFKNSIRVKLKELCPRPNFVLHQISNMKIHHKSKYNFIFLKIITVTITIISTTPNNLSFPKQLVY